MTRVTVEEVGDNVIVVFHHLVWVWRRGNDEAMNEEMKSAHSLRIHVGGGSRNDCFKGAQRITLITLPPTSSIDSYQYTKSPPVDVSQTSDLIRSVTNFSSVLGDSSGDISPHGNLMTRRLGGQLSAKCMKLFASRTSGFVLR